MNLLPGDEAALKAFEADLKGMTKLELEQAFQSVSEDIDSLTDWQEALAARLRQLG